MVRSNAKDIKILPDPETQFRKQYQAQHSKGQRMKGLVRPFLCFTMLTAFAVMSVSNSFAKYTASSEPIVIPPLQAAAFAFNAKEMTSEEAESYKSELHLNEKQIMACAFTVNNQDGETTSEVAMTCDAIFRAESKIDFENIEGSEVKRLLALLYNELHPHLYVDGVDSATLVSENVSSASAQAVRNDPMPMALNITLPFNYYLQNSDAISFPAGVPTTHKCAIVFDVSEYNLADSISITHPAGEPTLTIMCNQVQGGAKG